MFSMREFVKDGFLKAVGKMADYQIILNAAAWHEKGVLTEEDLAQIQSLVRAQESGNAEYLTEQENVCLGVCGTIE